MGLYLRKAFRAGPIRLNLSKSGLGLSGGVKGARVGVGTRGTYVHAGRHGLYYRKNLSSGRSGSRSEAEGAGCATAILIIVSAGLVLWLFNWLLDNPVVLGTGAAVAAGLAFLWWLIRFRRRKLVSAYKGALDAAFVEAESPPTSATLSALRRQQDRLPKTHIFKQAIENIEADVYQAVLDKILDDGFITKDEAATIAAAEQVLRLTPAVRMQTKKEIFSAAYLEAIEDRELSEDELGKLRNLLVGLSIPQSEVQRDLDIVHEILKTQSLRLPFKPKPREQLPVPIQKNEEAYYTSPAKVLSRRKSNDSRTGYEHSVRRDGTLVLTNKRVFVVGDGTTNIPFSGIADLDVDMDEGFVEITKTGSGLPIILKTGAPMYVGRAIELLMSAREE